MFAKLNKFRRDAQGAVAVEFAAVVVPFLMMVFGIFETGQILWASSQIDFHVDRVARDAAVDASMSVGTIRNEIMSSLNDLNPDTLEIAVQRAGGTPDVLTVTVRYTHNPVTPFLFKDGVAMEHIAAYPMIDG